MFKAVTLSANHVNIGNVADAMAYYQRTNLTLSSLGLIDLAESFGNDNLFRAIDIGVLEITFAREPLGINTKDDFLKTHHLVSFKLAADKNGDKIRTPYDEILIRLQDRFGKSQSTKLLARSISERLKTKPINRPNILQLARSDAKNIEFMKNYIVDWLRLMAPEYVIPDDLQLRIFEAENNGLVFLSNLDFEEINKSYHTRISPEHSSVSPASILANMLGVTNDAILSAEADTELWMSPSESVILRAKIGQAARLADDSLNKIDLFHAVEFNGRTFRDVINSGERSISDLLDLLEQAEALKFKTWMAEQPTESNLVKEYNRAIFEKTGWTTRLPFKVGKTVVFAGVGAATDLALGTMGFATTAAILAGAAADIAGSAGDEYLVSKLKSGWKPNQFVDGPGAEFLGLSKI